MTFLMIPCKDVAKMYGGGKKYKGIWDAMNPINKNAKALKEAFDAGLDPITVDLTEGSQKGNECQSLLQVSFCSLATLHTVHSLVSHKEHMLIPIKKFRKDLEAIAPKAPLKTGFVVLRLVHS